MGGGLELTVHVYATPPPSPVSPLTPCSKVVAEYQAKDADGRKGRVKFVAGDPQFKYFGRFALAILAKTPHVLLLDDDSIPGARVLQNSL